MLSLATATVAGLLLIVSLSPAFPVQQRRRPQRHLYDQVLDGNERSDDVVGDVNRPPPTVDSSRSATSPSTVVLLQVFDRSNADNSGSDVETILTETAQIRRRRRNHRVEIGRENYTLSESNNGDETVLHEKLASTDKPARSGSVSASFLGSTASSTLHLDAESLQTVSSNSGATVAWSDCRQLDLSKASAVLSASGSDDVTVNEKRSKLIEELRRRLSFNRTIVLCKPQLRQKSPLSVVWTGSGERLPVDLATQSRSLAFSRKSSVSTADEPEKRNTYDHRRDENVNETKPDVEGGRAKVDADNNENSNGNGADLTFTAKSVGTAEYKLVGNLTSSTMSDKHFRFRFGSPETPDKPTSIPNMIRHHNHSHHRLRHSRAFHSDSHGSRRGRDGVSMPMDSNGGRNRKPGSQQFSCELGGENQMFNFSNFLQHVEKTLHSYGCWNDKAKQLVADLERLSASSSSSSSSSIPSKPEVKSELSDAYGWSKNVDPLQRQMACDVRRHYEKCIRDSRARRAARIWRGIKEGRGWPGAYESSWPRQVYDVRGSDDETSMIFY